MKSCESAKDFYTGWDGNNYRGRCKVGSCIYVHSNCKHMMGSDNKPQEANCYYSPDHSHVAKGLFFTGVVGNNMRNHAESWEDQNIDLRMAEESE